MEIYVQVHSRDDGSCAWYNETETETYLMDGKDLWCIAGPNDYHDDYMRGTPFSTVAKAKRAAREAKDLAQWDGMVDVEVRFWRSVGGDLVLTKFTRDNKIKR